MIPEAIAIGLVILLAVYAGMWAERLIARSERAKQLRQFEVSCAAHDAALQAKHERRDVIA
jgi:hypothetical protein